MDGDRGDYKRGQNTGRGGWGGQGHSQGHKKDYSGGGNDTKSIVAKSAGEPSSDKALHPSWEASRKRKLQQTAIQNFAGKKTTFDD